MNYCVNSGGIVENTAVRFLIKIMYIFYSPASEIFDIYYYRPPNKTDFPIGWLERK